MNDRNEQPEGGTARAVPRQDGSRETSHDVASRWPRRQRKARLWFGVPTATVLAFILTLQLPTTGRASIFGEETAVLSAILAEDIAQVAQMVQTVANLYTQIRQLTTMIEQGATMLQEFEDPQDILRLLRMSQRLLRKEGAIERSIEKLHYKLTEIDRDHVKVFPAMKDVRTQEFQSKARNWNAALKESSAVAMRAQTSVDTLEERLDHATKLQRDSEAAEGVVGQLQIIVKSLALLHADLSAIEQNLAYGQRVTATMASVQANEEERATEERRRMSENYRDRGPEPRRLDALP